MASQLKVDTITGVTTAGSVVVTGEAGSTTTHFQQGLTKVWHNFDGESTVATRDSYNVSGLTDNGTGDYTSAFTNNMVNNDYSSAVGADSASGHLGLIYSDAQTATSSFRSYVVEIYSSAATDSDVVVFQSAGDLA